MLIRRFKADSLQDHEAWRALNLQWLNGYEHRDGVIPRLLEDGDFEALDRPLETVVIPGGEIWLAEWEGELVGSVALSKGLNGWELSKLAVKPEAQGRGIGRALVQTVVDAARTRGIKRLVLDSNHHLVSAVRLYESFGFVHIPCGSSKYATADVAMELILSASN